eukprot:339438-Rhodomonas_salina.1
MSEESPLILKPVNDGVIIGVILPPARGFWPGHLSWWCHALGLRPEVKVQDWGATSRASLCPAISLLLRHAGMCKAWKEEVRWSEERERRRRENVAACGMIPSRRQSLHFRGPFSRPLFSRLQTSL